jgi:hypothetical protein
MITVCVKWRTNLLTFFEWKDEYYRHSHSNSLEDKYKAYIKKQEAKKAAYYASIKRDKLDFMGLDKDGYEVYMDAEAQEKATDPLATPLEQVA